MDHRTDDGRRHQIEMPNMLYGTAWKREQTSTLVVEALEAGFRGVDVAAQPRHYREDLVGVGLRAAFLQGSIKREDIYLQTKFTWTSGQDTDSIPFNPQDPISEQVKTSVDASLYALRPRESDESVADSYIDCLLLHFPLPTLEQTVEAWKAMEQYVPHKVRSLGICNTGLLVMKVLWNVKDISIRPTVVQNRFFKETAYDVELRNYCRRKSIWYQAFGVLKSTPELLSSELVEKLAVDMNQTKEESLYQLVLGLGGISILNGTTNSTRMRDDIAAAQSVSSLIEYRAESDAWSSALADFRTLIEDDWQ